MKTYTIRAVTKGGVKLPEFECETMYPSAALHLYECKIKQANKVGIKDIQCIDIDIKESGE